MKYWTAVIRAFLTHDFLPRCTKCRRFCVKGWTQDTHPGDPWPTYTCTPCIRNT